MRPFFVPARSLVSRVWMYLSSLEVFDPVVLHLSIGFVLLLALMGFAVLLGVVRSWKVRFALYWSFQNWRLSP